MSKSGIQVQTVQICVVVFRAEVAQQMTRLLEKGRVKAELGHKFCHVTRRSVWEAGLYVHVTHLVVI